MQWPESTRGHGGRDSNKLKTPFVSLFPQNLRKICRVFLLCQKLGH